MSRVITIMAKVAGETVIDEYIYTDDWDFINIDSELDMHVIEPTRTALYTAFLRDKLEALRSKDE